DLQFARVGAELRCDRVVRIGGINKRIHRRRDRHSVAVGDFVHRLERGAPPRMRRGSAAVQPFSVRAQCVTPKAFAYRTRPPAFSTSGRSSSAMKCGPEKGASNDSAAAAEKPNCG